MLSASQIKELRRWQKKRTRDEAGVFVAEGDKLITELAGCFTLRVLVKDTQRSKVDVFADKVMEATPQDLERITLLKTARESWALFEKPSGDEHVQLDSNALMLAIDGVQDPGNLGTIIRIADWFGIEHVFCSAPCADAYGPKTVQSCMGSLARVRVHEDVDLVALLEDATKKGMAVYGTLLSGENIYEKDLGKGGMIVVGNEGNGIGSQLLPYITSAIKIPSYPQGRKTIDSLNVATATAIVCGEFRRRNG